MSWLVLGLAALVLVGTLVAGGQRAVFAGAWGSARAAIPLAVAAGCLLLWRTPRGERSGSRRQELFLVLAMAALTSLVQVPLAHAIYFCYAAPLAALAVLFVVRSQCPGVPRAALVLAAFYLLFPLIWLRDAMPHAFGSHYVRLEQSTPMELERSGLRVDPVAAPMYRDLVAEVRRRSADDAYIFAGPDCPEVYFLSGKRNPTRTFFDLFDTDYGTPARADRILRLLDKRRIKVVVLKHLVEVSKRGQRRLASRLSEVFPHQKSFNVAGQTVFTVLWRDGVDQPPSSLTASHSVPLLGSR